VDLVLLFDLIDLETLSADAEAVCSPQKWHFQHRLKDVSHPSAIQQEDAVQKMGPQPERGPQMEISQGMSLA
jgi:hypothetical protein